MHVAWGMHGVFSAAEKGVRAFTLCLDMEAGVRRFSAQADWPPQGPPTVLLDGDIANLYGLPQYT